MRGDLHQAWVNVSLMQVAFFTTLEASLNTSGSPGYSDPVRDLQQIRRHSYPVM
jgi:hypothetical protein